MHYQVLFFIEDDKIASYIYRDNMYELCPYKGENFSPLKNRQFFEWWLKINSFNRDKDDFNVCVLSDAIIAIDDLLANDINIMKQNKFTVNSILSFIKDELSIITPMIYTSISYNGKQHQIARIKKNEEEEKLHLSTFPPMEFTLKEKTIKKEIIPVIREKNETDIVKYFRDKTEKLNHKNNN